MVEYFYKIRDILRYRMNNDVLCLLGQCNKKMRELVSPLLQERKIYHIFPLDIIHIIGIKNLLTAQEINYNPDWSMKYYMSHLFRIQDSDIKNTFTYGKGPYNKLFIFIKFNIKTPNTNPTDQKLNTNPTTILCIYKKYISSTNYSIIEPKCYIKDITNDTLCPSTGSQIKRIINNKKYIYSSLFENYELVL